MSKANHSPRVETWVASDVLARLKRAAHWCGPTVSQAANFYLTQALVRHVGPGDLLPSLWLTERYEEPTDQKLERLQFRVWPLRLGHLDEIGRMFSLNRSKTIRRLLVHELYQNPNDPFQRP